MMIQGPRHRVARHRDVVRGVLLGAWGVAVVVFTVAVMNAIWGVK